MKVRRQRLHQLERRIAALEALLTPSEVSIEIAPRAIAPVDWQRLGEFTRRHRNNPPATKEVIEMKTFFKENWLTIVISAATTIVVRLLLGW